MTSIFDCAFTKTFDAVFEAAATTTTLYVDQKDESLCCSDWLSAAFTRKISVADIQTVTEKLDKAFSYAEHMLEIQPEQVDVKEVNNWAMAALRTQQLFEAAKERPTTNAMINEIAAHHTFHFQLPDSIRGCAVGLAHVVNGPLSIAKTREPNIVDGRYYYGEPFSVVKGLLQMAHMGLLTQLERLASVSIKIIQAVARIFGLSLPFLNQFHYFRNNETTDDIYDTASIPMSLKPADATQFSSYWIGHATCLFSVPVREAGGQHSRINIITDPIEEDVNALLYPRMTDPACAIEKCPPIHVCILTHNHQDHFSPAALSKLLRFNPLMVVPKGDGERLRSMGFTRVVEVGWFERVDVQVQDIDGKTYQIGICGTPANHGSGNQSQPARTSLFNGYIIQSNALDGDVYFAGDTARLDAEHTQTLRDSFAIRYSFQPGGPDEIRSLNADSHQSSCDGIAMHLHLMASSAYLALRAALGTAPSFEQLRAICSRLFTVYMHTKTYKLGNLHFDDTDVSIAAVLDWLKTHDSWDGITSAQTLKSYEKEVLREIAQEEGTHMIIADTGLPITPRQIGELLERTVTVPKIGARFSA